MANAPSKPVKVFRFRGVSASIFQNQGNGEGRDTTFYKVAIQRTYKDGNEFKHTSNFGREDIPVARYVLQQAWEFILGAESSANQAG